MLTPHFSETDRILMEIQLQLRQVQVIPASNKKDTSPPLRNPHGVGVQQEDLCHIARRFKRFQQFIHIAPGVAFQQAGNIFRNHCLGL